MLYLSDSVLKMFPSTRRISRRITLSRVVVLPTNEMRLTKNCLPSDSLIVKSTVGFREPFDPFEPFVVVEPLVAGGGGALPSLATGARPPPFGLRPGETVKAM